MVCIVKDNLVAKLVFFSQGSQLTVLCVSYKFFVYFRRQVAAFLETDCIVFCVDANTLVDNNRGEVALACKGFRKQGLCRKLMDDTRGLLLELGYSGILLVPEMHLFGMYESMGYKTCSTVTEFSCRRSHNPVALQEINAEEYAVLRRQFLPEGGVLQENENLQYLAAITKLYTGDGFLYAEDAELLGNADAAPGILAALGKDSGRFRCPGGDIPFAMYLPLDGNPAPSYVGLAFD